MAEERQGPDQTSSGTAYVCQGASQPQLSAAQRGSARRSAFSFPAGILLGAAYPIARHRIESHRYPLFERCEAGGKKKQTKRTERPEIRDCRACRAPVWLSRSVTLPRGEDVTDVTRDTASRYTALVLALVLEPIPADHVARRTQSIITLRHD